METLLSVSECISSSTVFLTSTSFNMHNANMERYIDT